MRNEDGHGTKQTKSHRERKNGRGHDEYVERNRVRNAARPLQRFLGIDPQTGFGLGWIRP